MFRESLPLLIIACAHPPQSAPDSVPIPVIQGKGHLSPLVGRTVTTTGIVTAVAPRGFYFQDPRGDGDDATSDGIWVFTKTRPSVSPGDELLVQGTVGEFVPGGESTANLTTTEITEPPVIEVRSRRHRLPRAVIVGRGGRVPPGGIVISPDELPVNLRRPAEATFNRFNPETDGIDFYESLEGMLVTIRRPVAVSPSQTFSRTSSEIFALADGGADQPKDARTPWGGIYLRSGPDTRGNQNPERIQIQLDRGVFPAPVPAIAVGDRMSDVTGVVSYGYGNFKVRAIEPFSVTSAKQRPDTTAMVGSSGAITIATYNLLNLSAQPSDDLQRAALARQIVRNLRQPDVLAFQEIQDNSGETDDGTTDASKTLQALADAVGAAGGPRYRFFDVPPANGRPGGAPGANIRNAFFYNPARVRLVDSRSLTSGTLAAAGIAGSGAFRNSRDPLAATFEFAGRRLTLINNHLTSRFGSTPTFGAVQPFAQAGENGRGAQARALHDYVASLLAADPVARVIVLGDMNTFEFSKELSVTLPGRPAILYNLLDRSREEGRYTYNYEGNSQVLDHVFVTGSLLNGAELDVVHLNVDFPAHEGVIASDHDPVVAKLTPS
jgi:predicted extracellular nuclease